MANLTIDQKTNDALSHLQNTQLTPMEEALFQAWAKANQIKKPDDPTNQVDLRGIYQMSGGTILPNGELKRITDQLNNEANLQDLLHRRIMDHVNTLKQEKKNQLPIAPPVAPPPVAPSPLVPNATQTVAS